jgi:glucose 1-dehydrogenase
MPGNSSQSLEGQVALVTGGSSGVAVALAAAGAAVGVNYASSPERAAAVVSEIERAGGAAVALQANVSREEQVEAVFRGLLGHFGRLDILVANAAIQKDAAFANMTLDQWRTVLDINLTGQFLCAREAVRIFDRQGRDAERSAAAGKIIRMRSVHGVIPWVGHVNYSASRGGIMLMMKSLAQEVASRGIRVNGIAPGAIQTDINRAAWETPQALQCLLALIPYGRIGQPEDVARAAVWLASDASDYVTGTMLFVDGRMTLYPGFRENG